MEKKVKEVNVQDERGELIRQLSFDENGFCDFYIDCESNWSVRSKISKKDDGNFVIESTVNYCNMSSHYIDEKDSNGRVVYHEDEDTGEKRFYEYDKNGRRTSTRCFDKDGNLYHKLITEYNDNGDIVFCSDDNSWFRNEYDSNGNLIKTSYSDESFDIYEYDDNNRLIHKKLVHDDIFEEWKEYDNNGKLRKVKDNRGNETINFYDIFGEKILSIGNKVVECRSKYFNSSNVSVKYYE